MDIKHEVARSLLSIEAVFLRPQEPFTWASGRSTCQRHHW